MRALIEVVVLKSKLISHGEDMEITIQIPDSIGKIINSFEGSEKLILEALNRVAQKIEEKKSSFPQEKKTMGIKTKWKKSNKKEVGKALRELKEMAPFSDIENPVEWQRTIRKDRDLPFR